MKTGIELGQVSRQDPVGTLQVVGTLLTQFFDQAVLQGIPQSFDASFGLGTAVGDQLDDQLVYQTAKLAVRRLARQHLFPTWLAGALKDRVLVGIEGLGNTAAQTDLLQAQKIDRRILFFPEDGCRHLIVGVIDHADQR